MDVPSYISLATTTPNKTVAQNKYDTYLKQLERFPFIGDPVASEYREYGGREEIGPSGSNDEHHNG